MVKLEDTQGSYVSWTLLSWYDSIATNEQDIVSLREKAHVLILT